jgi:hypothetical protein
MWRTVEACDIILLGWLISTDVDPELQMIRQVPLLRVFLSSPGDVNDERKAVLEVLDRLPYRPAYRERVQFRVIAWDKPGADTPMLATMSPQEAIEAGLPRPSECDIVVVIFWSRAAPAQ